MLTLQMIACIGMIVGAFLLLGIRLNDFTGNIFRKLLNKPQGIREEILEETKQKKKAYLRREIEEVQKILHTTGREDFFPMLCTISLLLFAAGAFTAVMLGNVFLIPVLAGGFLFLPFWYVKLTASHFKKDVSAELETALSIITTAYLRSEDILTSIEENLAYLNPPVKNVFADFVARVRLIDPDLEAALDVLKETMENEVFQEWVDAMKACLYDRSLKTTENMGGCFVDLMSGEYIINVLEPKTWDENGSPEDAEAPEAFRCLSRLSQHISFLKDFFRSYKNFTDNQIDTIEIMLEKLYEKWNIRDNTDFGELTPEDYPILSDLYDLMEEEYRHYDPKKKQLYTAELLQEICLGLHSMCKGAESKFFNGYTNITDNSFLTFGVKGLLQASKNVKDAMLFNILSYMSDALLTNGHTAACIDELYLFLTNLTAVEYIRNFAKRVRKKDSAVILASQNLEDFNIDGIREYTKPLFSIPTHAFLFNAGNIDARFYMDMLQLDKSEYELIRYPQRGVCLYKCGNERYNLMVHAPEYKEKLFGTAGGR